MAREDIEHEIGERKDTPESRAREAALEDIKKMTPEEFEKTCAAAQLSPAETLAIRHRCDTDEWLATNKRRQAVQELYFAVKHPSLSRIFQKLNLEVKDPADHERMEELDEQEKNFTHWDFMGAIKKLQRHLGWDKAYSLTDAES